MAFEYTLRSFDILDFAQDTQIRVDERDKELETYTLSIDTSFLNLNASNLTSGTVPSARVTGSYTGITGVGALTVGSVPASLLTGTTLPAGITASSLTSVGTLSTLAMGGSITGYGGFLYFGTNPGDLSIYLGTNTGFGNVNIQYNSTTKLSVGSTGITVTGTVFATSFSGTTGALASLTIDGASSPSFTVGDWAPATQYSGITGNTGYLLVGTNAADTAMYLRTSTAGAVNIGANNSNTLSVGNGAATLSGTLTATTFSGSGANLTSIPAGQLTGTVASARISGSYTGFTSIAASNEISFGNVLKQTNLPTSGAGIDAEFVTVGGEYHIRRNTSTRKDKENIQPLNAIVTPSMVDAINVQLWNRKTAPGIPEIGPIAEDMHDISPFLSAKGVDFDADGNMISKEPEGINKNAWLSLLTIAIQDLRQRLQQLETT